MSVWDGIELLLELLNLPSSSKKEKRLEIKGEKKFQFDRCDFIIFIISFLSILAIILIILVAK